MILRMAVLLALWRAYQVLMATMAMTVRTMVSRAKRLVSLTQHPPAPQTPLGPTPATSPNHNGSELREMLPLRKHIPCAPASQTPLGSTPATTPNHNGTEIWDLLPLQY